MIVQFTCFFLNCGTHNAETLGSGALKLPGALKNQFSVESAII